ncbi:MAG: benzoate/H(+) symporter BenE family transporter [Cyanobacteria bacterium J06632_3]
MSFREDVSLSAIVAGFITVLVGLSGGGVIVFQAAQSLGASPTEIASWIWALGIGIGITSIVLSAYYRKPVITAWSTPGAAMLITAAAGLSMAEAVGAFLTCAVLMTICGFSGWFERVMNLIPLPLAAGMLAGILLRFGLNAFSVMQTQFVMAAAMFGLYLVMRRTAPRYAVLSALIIGILMAGLQGLLKLEAVQFQFAQPVFVAPAFSISAVVGVGLPLFLVTMASQNMPGVATIRAFGYDTPISPLIGWTGITTVVLAPFGGFTFNLAAITAALSMGPEAHKDPNKRYVAAIATGVFYIIVGLFGTTVSSLFAALPEELVMEIAGLALLSTIGKSLVTALGNERDRDSALITFLVTASGLSLFGIGAAFWGLSAGLLAIALLGKPRLA